MSKTHRQGTVATAAAGLAAGLAAVLSLTACSGDDGGDNGGDNGGNQAETSDVSTTEALDPVVQWADGMCGTVARTAITLDPPQLDQSDVAGALGVLSGMFATMADQLDQQHADLTGLAPPPGAKERTAYRTALRHLDEAVRVAHRVERTLAGAAERPPADIQDAFAQTGGLKVDGADYPGFVLDLAGLSKPLMSAIGAAPSCADVAPL